MPCVFDLEYVLSIQIKYFLMSIVSPLTSGGHELMVLGKQLLTVRELFTSLRVPKWWIKVSGRADRKK